MTTEDAILRIRLLADSIWESVKGSDNEIEGKLLASALHGVCLRSQGSTIGKTGETVRENEKLHRAIVS